MNTTYLTVKSPKGQLMPSRILRRDTLANVIELNNEYKGGVYRISVFEIEKAIPKL